MTGQPFLCGGNVGRYLLPVGVILILLVIHVYAEPAADSRPQGREQEGQPAVSFDVGLGTDEGGTINAHAGLVVHWNDWFESSLSGRTEDYLLKTRSANEIATLHRSGFEVRLFPIRLDQDLFTLTKNRGLPWLKATAGVAVEFELIELERYGFDSTAEPVRFFVETAQSYSWRPLQYYQVGITGRWGGLSTYFISTLTWGMDWTDLSTTDSMGYSVSSSTRNRTGVTKAGADFEFDLVFTRTEFFFDYELLVRTDGTAINTHKSEYFDYLVRIILPRMNFNGGCPYLGVGYSNRVEYMIVDNKKAEVSSLRLDFGLRI